MPGLCSIYCSFSFSFSFSGFFFGIGFGLGVIAVRACGVSDGISGNTKVYGVYTRGRCDIWVVNVEWVLKRGGLCMRYWGHSTDGSAPSRLGSNKSEYNTLGL